MPVTQPGPRQNFPLRFTAIAFSGDWIVVVVEAHRLNTTDDYKVAGWDDYEQGGDKDGERLELFPFDADKGSGWKSPQIDKDHPEWRGNKNDSSADDFTALYFVNNEKKTSATIELEFPGIGQGSTSTDIGYYVWRIDNPIVNGGAQTSGPVVPPYVYPEPPDKDAALGPNPFNPSTAIPYIGIYNFWDFYGWIDVKNRFANAGLPEPPFPDGNHYGWSTAAKRDQFLLGLNTIAEQSANAPIIPNANYPLEPHYKALGFDFGGPSHPSDPASATYTVDAYHLHRNNMIFDSDNKLKFKLPEVGKSHATRSFTQGQPSDPRKLKVTWTAKAGIAIIDA